MSETKTVDAVTTVAHVGDSSYTPRMAAEEFAQIYWAQPRKINKHWLVEGHQLSCEFTIQGGSATYRAAWHDVHYTIIRFGL